MQGRKIRVTTLLSRIPHGIRLIGCYHTLGDVTVAPGKAYSHQCFKPTAHEMNSPSTNYCLTPTDSSLQVRSTDTIFRSNAFEKIKDTLIVSLYTLFVKRFS